MRGDCSSEFCRISALLCILCKILRRKVSTLFNFLLKNNRSFSDWGCGISIINLLPVRIYFKDIVYCFLSEYHLIVLN